MSLNFNVGPYYDDFDPTKNFHRILFKPGSAVQARELTQSQTILQNQISNFASSIFTQNTPVSGGQVTTNLNCYFIKLNNTDQNGATVKASNFLNKVITDPTGTILASVIATAETTSAGSVVGDPPTLIVTYLSGIQFTDSTFITPTDGSTFSATVATSTVGNPSTGLSSTASVASGTFYIVNGYSQSSTQNADGSYTQYSIGNFVQVNPQTIILDKYDNTPSFRIGLQITETIYDYVNDASLLDPAIGASNYQAPGADRYVITLSLVTLPITLGNDDGFIELCRIVNGNITKQVDGTVYSTIDDYFAKRDYETNGDYIVNDFKLTPGPNAGGNTTEYDISVGKGVAYVHGYRVENQSQIVLTNQRAQTTANINNNNIAIDYGNYYVVDTANGVFDISTMPSVDFHCVPAANIITGSSANAVTYASTLIGSAYMRNFTYVSGTGSNTKSYVFNAYISDLNTNTLTGNVSSTTPTTTSFIINDTNGSFSASANAYYNMSVSVTTGGITDVRNIVSYTTTGGVKTINVDKAFTVVPTGSSTFTLLFQNVDTEAIIKIVGNGKYNVTANVNINAGSGKVNGQPTGDSVLYSPGTPELIFPVGYPFVSEIVNTNYYSQRVYRGHAFSGSTLTLYATSQNGGSPLRFDGSAEGNFIVVDNTTGNILDFTSSGNTITLSSDKTQANLSSAAYSGKSNVSVIATVYVSTGDSPAYTLKTKNLITGNTSYTGSFTAVGSTGVSQDLTNAQVIIPRANIVSGTKMSLYVNDIKRIRKIVDSGTAGTNPTGSLANYKDITNYFTLDNGQRDSYYDHGSVTLQAGAPMPTGNILVVFDYYSHTKQTSGDGYFSVQSYANNASNFGGGIGVSASPEAYPQIPTYTAKDGNIYKLSDCIDFRPCRVNGQTSYIWEYSSQSQPTGSSDVGMLLPANLYNFVSNYYYYLGRQDKLVLTKDKSFQIVQGTPSTNPSLPTEPSGSLVIANLLHDPYTAYVPGEAPAGVVSNLSVNKVIHKRWAKSDITDLETRVNNLEYYTSLSILEQNAQSLQVPDQNGLNRFKNGILVDDFSSYSTADTSNADYAANINIRNNQMTALQMVDNFQLQNPVVLNSLGTLPATPAYQINSISGTQTNIFTLPYTTANVVTQPLASNTISVNPFSVVVQQGVAQLNPPMDNWVDNQQAPAILVTDPSLQIYQASAGVNYLNAGDAQTIPGTSSTSTSITNNFNHGTITNSPFGATVGFTQTTTQTYASQLSNTTSGAYNPTSSSFSNNNGYLTNIAVLPYIRPQQIVVRARGLLVNTPVSTYFDGANVASYMTAPNTIEVSNVSGSFNQDDVVGFYVAASSTFYPIARVISVYNYPNGTQSRLYVSDVVGAPNTVGSTTLQNALFDVSGNYIPGSATATGTISSGITTLNPSGSVGGVGGGYANVISGNTTTQFYATPIVQGYSAFLNNFGIWGDLNNSTAYHAVFPVYFPTSGNYTITVGCSGSATITANGSSIGSSLSGTPSGTQTLTLSIPTGGVTANIGWSATSSGTTTSAFAMTIVDPANDPTPIFASTNPPNLNYLNAGTEVVMPGGGSWFEGATQIRLDPSAASNISNYYVGSTIQIQSLYVYTLNVAATYVPPPAAPSSSQGYGCVVATELARQNNGWSKRDMLRLMSWSFKNLDQTNTGKVIHRGYQVIGPRFLLPIVKKRGTLAAKYIKWSFNQATNMLQGKKFNPLSILNTSAWIVVMAATGLAVTAKEALQSVSKGN
jgi:hypothetical protein